LAGESDNDLARANLSHAYVDGGFLRTAEETANSVLAGGAEAADRERAGSALRRIRVMRGEETDKEERLLREARGEAEFRAAYAGAYLDEPAPPVAGQFETPHGVLAVRQDGNRLTGDATLQETVPRTALLALVPGSGGATRDQTRVLRLEGAIHQR